MSQLNRRQALRLFAAVGAAGTIVPALSACTGSGADSDENETSTAGLDGRPIKVGMIVPQTGVYKPYGDDMANGFQLYVKLNGNRLGGHPVEIISVDEGEDPGAMAAAVDKLVKQDGVIALTGVVNPATMLAVRDKVESSQVPLVGSNASPGDLSGAKYIWRTSYAAPDPAQALGKWVADHAGGSIAILAAEGQGDDGSTRTFLDEYKKNNGKLVTPETFFVPTGSANFANVFNQIKTAQASGLVCMLSGQQANEFVKQFNKGAGFRSGFKVWAPGGLTEGYALKQQGDAAKDIFTSMNYSPDLDNAANRRFLGEYQKAYSALPSAFAMASYDAGAVLDRALAGNREELTSIALNASIGRLGQLDSPRGTWQFNQNRCPLQRWYLRQVKVDGSVLSNVLTAELTTLG